jgi:hypothetical protein
MEDAIQFPRQLNANFTKFTHVQTPPVPVGSWTGSSTLCSNISDAHLARDYRVEASEATKRALLGPGTLSSPSCRGKVCTGPLR